MRDPTVRLSLFLALLCTAQVSAANCRLEIGANLPNQIGHIVLFTTRGGGPSHPQLNSEFWAISGPSDTFEMSYFPVRFEQDAETWANSVDWKSLAGAPILLKVLGDGHFDGELVWLKVRKVLDSDDEYKEALTEYPEARRGTCGSYFGRSDA